jgi:hypothetical protein
MIQNTEFNRGSYWVPGRASYKMSMMQTEFQQRIVLVFSFQKEHPIKYKCGATQAPGRASYNNAVHASGRASHTDATSDPGRARRSL